MSNLKNFLKKNKLIIILGIIAVVLVVLKSFFLPPIEKSLPQPTPTLIPTPTSKPSFFSPSPLPDSLGKGDPELFDRFLEKTRQNFPLAKFLPYEDENFSLDYIGPLKLRVLFKTPQASQSAVFDWIGSKGVDPSTHQIEFASF